MSHFMMPSHVFIGKEALKEAIPFLKSYGKRAFVVTGKHVGKSSMMECLKRTLEEAGILCSVFDGITGEPTDKMIEEGALLYQKSGSRFCIGIGGGSPIDAAKAIAVMVTESNNSGSRKIADYNGKEIIEQIPPIVAIPTTAGTGSETTRYTVITDLEKNIKMLLKGDVLIPEIAILNYDNTMDMPKNITASTGLDALTHAIEAYVSQKAFALTDIYAVSAIKRIMKYLPIAYQNGYDEEAREQMSLAAFEAGVCINNSSVTLVHGMSRPIGALFHVPHGMSNAMLLKECLSFALEGAVERFAKLGRAIQAADETQNAKEAAEKFLEKVAEVCRICEIPTLKEYGIEEQAFTEVIEKMSEDAVASGSPANTRREVTKEDCMEIYRRTIGL